MKRFKLDSRYVDRYVDKKKRSVKETSSSRDTTALANKPKKVEEESNKEEEQRSTACVSHGLVSVIGRRRVMEDAVAVAINGEVDSYDFFAVYDGHGGAHVADACKDRLHLIIAKEMEARGKRGGRRLRYWEDVMAASFAKMDEEVCRGCGGEGDEEKREVVAASMNNVGSTAVVVMVGKEEVVVANCGDSRAVLCRGGEAVALSRDHKPDRPDEKERVENAGGRIINWNGSRVLGVLATSRSIGDQYLKPYVVSEPEVTVSERSPLDDFLIIASDGLWDVVSNEFACDVVKRCPNDQLKMRFPEECNVSCATKAATMLTELALARGSIDNISVIVVELKKSSSISS